jgi:hypothetical protein
MSGAENEETRRGEVLLAIARESLAEALSLGHPRQEGERKEPWLSEPGATFVTLTRRGELRGCVGSVRAYRALFDDVWANARASAFQDTRFPPLAVSEFPEIRVEVSVLSPPEPLAPCGEDEACARLRPGLDGLILECGTLRSTFLPQVWQQLEDPRDFLGHLKVKAGLPRDFWSPEVRLLRYTVAKWVEKPPRRGG